MGQSQSQGQRGLFPEAPYMAPARRYKRGYTPGRMAEVRDALTAMQPNGKVIPGTDTEYLSRQSVVRTPEMSDGLMEGSRKSVANRHARAVHEAIARSTVPSRSLRSVRSIETDDARLAEHDAAGLFHPKTGTIVTKTMSSGDQRANKLREKMQKRFPDQKEGAARRQRTRDDEARGADVTLIHELGHAVSYNNGNRNMERRRFSPEPVHGGGMVIGEEEAYADDFAVKHHRQDPRERARNGEQEKHTYLSVGAMTHKNRAYVESRRNLQPSEKGLAMNDEELSAHNLERTAAAGPRPTGQRVLPGFSTKEMLGSGPTMTGNNLNGRQFGSTR